MAITNPERIGKALTLLGEGLEPFVARECEAKYGTDWQAMVQRPDPRSGRSRPVNTQDPQFLLNVMWDEWNSTFGRKLSRSDRTFVAELQGVRNAWAHNEGFSTDDAYRGLDTAQRLLESVAAGPQANEVSELLQELLRKKYEEQTRSKRRTAQRIDTGVAVDLPPWREVIAPHDDVTSGRFEMAQYAADLYQVWKGKADDEYGNATQFYQRTFITDGLSKLITGATQRFSGTGGDPVVKLQTNFGGGKTHALIALYHLAGAGSASDLPGVEDLLARNELRLPGEDEVRRVVLVGHQLSPGSPIREERGCKVRTMWGELAWQLGGPDAYDHIAEADRTATNPGAALGDLLQAYAPCLILIDEWVAYARQLFEQRDLSGGTFEAHFTFAQALADAVSATPRALLVATIPDSQIEVGGEGGEAALRRLEHLFGRVEANWSTATAEESFEIVRRRLFKGLSDSAARRRDGVVAAFGKLYAESHGEFPSVCREADYRRRIEAAYPVHPELFDRLFGDWSSLERFQRTRGVLRLMAKIIHSLWHNQDSSSLIMPGTVPADDSDVVAEMIRYLDGAWSSVMEAEVDGANSLPRRLDSEQSSLGQYSAARRVARTVYFGSAPSQQAANKGLDDRHIKLGCVQPGERTAPFTDALRRLSDEAAYLYSGASRYWYALAPTVTRLARDRAADINPLDVDEQIRRRLGTQARCRSEFSAVHVCPRSTGDVPDDDTARLVIIDPEYRHEKGGDSSEAMSFASEVLEERSGGARRYRNMLVFLAPDSNRLEELRQAVRQWLAWKSITSDVEVLNLDAFQKGQAETKASEFDETVDQRIAETYQWVLNPDQPPDDPTASMSWDTINLSSSGLGRGADTSLAERVAKKLISNEGLVTGYSGSRLRLDIDRVPLWRGDTVSVNQLWEDYAQFLYLPRLRDRSVLEDAVHNGVASLTWQDDGFAYADAVVPATQEGGDNTDSSVRYAGLKSNQVLDALAPSGLLVKPSAAIAQQVPDQVQDEDNSKKVLPPDPPKPILPTRYWGRITLDSSRWTSQAADIADAVVNQLASTDGADAKITIEVEATAPDGFSEATKRTITENAATLKFNSGSFEP